MIRVLACLLSFLFVQQVHAQQVYYIYIQSADRKPFYARMNSRVISSTANGYLLMPKLQNGGYRAAIGFPGKTGEEEFLFTIDNADQGYDLKETPGGSGHVLMNLLTYKMENPVASGAEPKKENTSGTGFGDLLAEAVKDPSVKNIELAKKEEPPKPILPAKEKELPPVVDSPAVKKGEPVVVEEKKTEAVVIAPPDTMMIKSKPVETPVTVKEEPKVEITKPEPPAITGNITTIFRRAGNDGTDLVLADRTNGSNDTIRIFIPRLSTDKLETPPAVVTPPKEKELLPVTDTPALKQPEPVIAEEKKEEPVVKTEVKTEPPKQPENPKTEPPAEIKKEDKFLGIELKNPNSGMVPDTLFGKKADTAAAPNKLVMVNTDCKKIADDNDFIKLRTKMAGEKSNEEMISVAVKEFRKRCFTSEQVKNLSVLITGDDGKYRFYEVAYPYTYDTNNYSMLESQLTESYFISKFKTLVRKN